VNLCTTVISTAAKIEATHLLVPRSSNPLITVGIPNPLLQTVSGMADTLPRGVVSRLASTQFLYQRCTVYLQAAQQVTLLEIPTALDRAEGDVHGDGNPHLQLDPRRMLRVATALSTRLQTIDPANSADYQQRIRQFTGRWQEAIARWQEQRGALKGKRVSVHRREWTWLPDWLGMQRVGSLEPKPGIPPNLSHLADLKQQSADLIIISPLNAAKPAAWLQKQTGTPVVVLPQTVGAAPNSDDLFGLFDGIIRRLSAGGQT
jgi:zinc/manganese transport system substrate-binding protein